MDRDLNSIQKAVLRTYGTRLLNLHDASCARGVFAMTATQAGIPLVKIADALGCTYATVVNAHMACLHSFEEGDRQIRDDVAKVELILDEQLAPASVTKLCDGAIAPSRMTSEFWLQIVDILGRELRQTPNGLECDFIAEAYEAQCGGQLIPSVAERVMVIPDVRSEDGRRLELSLRSFAADGYADGDLQTTWDVVLTAGLLSDGKEEA